MPELNVDTPFIECLVRDEYLYNLQSGHGDHTLAIIFGACSLPSRAIGFHAMLENGAQIARLPITAFCWKSCVPLPLHVAELWDCFGPHMTCTEFRFLKGLRVEALGADKVWRKGAYLFTLDWHGDSYSENPGDAGHKNAHVIRLDDGNFTALPNNRIYWREPSFITKPLQTQGPRPEYKTNTHVWRCEARDWVTEDNNQYFYEVT